MRYKCTYQVNNAVLCSFRIVLICLINSQYLKSIFICNEPIPYFLQRTHCFYFRSCPLAFTKQPIKLCSLAFLCFIGYVCSGQPFVFLCNELKYSNINAVVKCNHNQKTLTYKLYLSSTVGHAGSVCSNQSASLWNNTLVWF